MAGMPVTIASASATQRSSPRAVAITTKRPSLLTTAARAIGGGLESDRGHDGGVGRFDDVAALQERAPRGGERKRAVEHGVGRYRKKSIPGGGVLRANGIAAAHARDARRLRAWAGSGRLAARP